MCCIEFMASFLGVRKRGETPPFLLTGARRRVIMPGRLAYRMTTQRTDIGPMLAYFQYIYVENAIWSQGLQQYDIWYCASSILNMSYRTTSLKAKLSEATS